MTVRSPRGSPDRAGEFLQIIERQKEKASQHSDDSDFIDAFVACGGNGDGSGHVTKDTLVRIIKHDFGLTIDVSERLMGSCCAVNSLMRRSSRLSLQVSSVCACIARVDFMGDACSQRLVSARRRSTELSVWT
jgi:hypothetical protein